MSVIDEVKQRTDIAEVIGQYASLKKAGKNLTALCPFHSEKHPSFFVYPEQQSWHCFGACSTGGDVYSFVMKKEGIDFGEALRLLAQRAGITIPSKFEQGDRKEEKERLYQINEAAAQYYYNILLNSPAAERARSYVTRRGFSTKTVSDFQLGFSLDSWEALKQYMLERGYTEKELVTAGLAIEGEKGGTHDRFRGRLMFPTRDIRGHTIGFGARVLDDSLPKFLNSPQTPTFDKSNALYGIDLAAPAIRKQDTAVIVEGYIDVITAHQNGITNVVACMGTSLTEQQVSTLKRLTRNLALALDADSAGEEAMLRGVSYENILDAEMRIITLPEGKDPDDVIKADAKVWQDLAEKAIPIIDYTFNAVASGLDLTTARDQSIAVRKLAPVVSEIKDPVRQAHYMQKLARLIDKSVPVIEAVLGKMGTSPARIRTEESKQDAIARALRPLASSPIEEYFLALLLQHPELKADCDELLLPEYFEYSENREIFIAWQLTHDLISLKERVDSAIHEHLDSLINKQLQPTQVEQKCHDYICRLQERFLKSLEAKRAEILALEAETGGSSAELAKLAEQGIETSIQLGEIQKRQRRSKSRR